MLLLVTLQVWNESKLHSEHHCIFLLIRSGPEHTKYLTLNCVIIKGGIHVGALVAKSLLAHYALINGTLGIAYKQIL